MSTQYHAKYLAHELTRRLPAEKAEKLSQSLCNATVDLNPHQIEAALFAFRSPLSRGAILADEVGLGKTIEAGLIVTQLWAEQKRKILCIVPASLRKQWNRELTEKFYIDSLILESASYRAAKKEGAENPFLVKNRVVICSYQFANSKLDDLRIVDWDLVVIDEAHRLRNVYKKSNKIARNLRDVVGGRPKILLTATPLQNSLMELYGLVSFVDGHIFGNEDTFRDQYAKRNDGTPSAYQGLKNRIQPVCQRTLRRQVTEYVRYTKRTSITQDFTPTSDEQQLYEQVSEYLQKPDLFALPSGQRQLITLVLRKILASSSFAIGDTLGTMIDRLERMQAGAARVADESAAEVVGGDVEHVDEIEDEWKAVDASAVQPSAPPTADQEKVDGIRLEIDELKSYRSLAASIQNNAKGDALVTALKAGFAKASELGAPQKALIFTESRRTQLYLQQLLDNNGYAGQIVLFNGSNSDAASKQIYRDWCSRHEGQEIISGSPTSDVRAALVEEFRERASIMIATESAAEGVNLQFCNLVVNYDLPWNPQRIEQRIGRCHRYGQLHDVVVINFLNRANQADQRVFELLDQKFKLFDGVFGASDDVLGVLESGADFEKRISAIYQTCRTPAEINAAFDQLQRDLEAQIDATFLDARSKLLENFDEDVQRRLKLRSTETKVQLGRFSELLWSLTKTELEGCATFDHDGHAFSLLRRPEGVANTHAPLGHYRLLTEAGSDTDIHYRLGHPLAEALVTRAKERSLPPREILFDYSNHPGKVTLVEQLQGKTGWLRATVLSVSALEIEDSVIFCGMTDDGQAIDTEACEKLICVPGAVGASVDVPAAVVTELDQYLHAQRIHFLEEAMSRNQRYFDAEMLKLEQWAEDLKENLERELKELQREITATKREARQAIDLKAKVALHKKVTDLERSRNEKRRSLFEAHDKIENDKERLIGEVEAQLEQKCAIKELFTIRWSVQ